MMSNIISLALFMIATLTTQELTNGFQPVLVIWLAIVVILYGVLIYTIKKDGKL